MGLKVKAGGVWNDASKVHIKLAGVWQTAKQLWAYASGGWRSAWQNEIRYINTANRTGASVYELMGSPSEPGDYVFENQATITAGSGSYALRTGVFPAGSTLTIVNKGYIRGRGGNGGNYNSAGGAGGAALYIDMNCTLDNAEGYIYGGGGGGGGARCYVSTNIDMRAAGGGGAGSNAGSAGTGMYGYMLGSITDDAYYTRRDPVAGSTNGGGLGGYIGSGTNPSTTYAKAIGGDGGGLGAAGVAGSNFTPGKDMTELTYAGGAAGAAILRNGKSVSITAGNNTTRIKGSIV